MGAAPPVTFAKYTGQEGDERARRSSATARHPPHELRDARADPHPLPRPHAWSAGRPASGSSSSTSCTPTAVARAPTSPCWSGGCARRRGRRELLCVGTSATLSTEGSHGDRQTKVAEVASLLFGAEVRPSEVITETLERATPEGNLDDPAFIARLTARVRADTAASTEFDVFVTDPLSVWIEATFGLRVEDRGASA